MECLIINNYAFSKFWWQKMCCLHFWIKNVRCHHWPDFVRDANIRFQHFQSLFWKLQSLSSLETKKNSHDGDAMWPQLVADEFFCAFVWYLFYRKTYIFWDVWTVLLVTILLTPSEKFRCTKKSVLNQFVLLFQIYIVYNKKTGKPRGYAFIEYEHERDMHCEYYNFCSLELVHFYTL